MYLDLREDIIAMKKMNHRVLFQNADGSINMGVCFNDPDISLYDIFWLNEVSTEMGKSCNKELISINEDLQTRSCYVELHRNDGVYSDK